MASLQDLLAQKQALEQKIVEVQREERSQAIAKVRALMDEYGLSAADLVAKGAGARPKGKSGGSGKVAVKYRNAATGDTWTGRGLQPKWLKAALATGRKLGDFQV